MTRSAFSLVGPQLRAKLGPLVVRESAHDDDLLQVKIESDLIRPEDEGSQVDTILDPDGTFRFKRTEYDYWES